MVPFRLRLGGTAAALATLVATSFVPAAHAAAPAPGVGIRLLDAPVAREGDPRARQYVVDQIRPGGQFTRRVEVSNGDPTAATLRLYAAPATISNGGFSVGPRGAPGSVPAWTTVTPSQVDLPPGGHAEALVTVHVPADAPPGEVYGGVVAERPAPPGPGVGVALRAAIRVYLSVGPGGEPASDFVIDSLQAERGQDGLPRVVAQVHNTGGRALDMRGSLSLTAGPGGLSAGPFPAALGTTLGIGQTEPVTVVLTKVISGGPWTANLKLSSGVLDRRATATITFPDQVGTVAVPVKATPLSPYKDRGVVGAAAAVLIGLVALALVGTGFLTRRRRRGAK